MTKGGERVSEQIDSAGFAFSMGEDGVLRLHLDRGTIIDLDLAKRVEAEGKRLFGEKPSPILIYADDAKSIDRDARQYLANIPGPTAQALLVVSPVGRVIAAALIRLGKQTPYPIRAFSREDEALEWLKAFR